MSKVAIVTDSNSGITQAEAKKLGIFVLPMPFLIDGSEYYEDVSLTQEEFYTLLSNDAQVSTSQPAAAIVAELWENVLKEYDEIVHIPMSSGLSESCRTAEKLSDEYGGRVCVVNNQRISVTQKASVTEALKLATEGKSAREIKDFLEARKYDSSIYIALDTLKYLKKGGRLTPAAALIGGMLRLRPVLTIQGEKLDKFAIAKTEKQAKKIMLDAISAELKGRFAEYVANGEMELSVAHSNNPEGAKLFAEEIEGLFPNLKVSYIDPLSLSVSCHIGPGSLAVTCQRVLR